MYTPIVHAYDYTPYIYLTRASNIPLHTPPYTPYLRPKTTYEIGMCWTEIAKSCIASCRGVVRRYVFR